MKAILILHFRGIVPYVERAQLAAVGVELFIVERHELLCRRNGVWSVGVA